MAELDQVMVGDLEVQLVLPSSYAVRYEVFLASANSQPRAWAAALGLCWSGPGKPKARYEASFNPLVYGGQVMDELVKRGLRPAQVAAAGAIAHNRICAEFLTESEVAAIEGFSEAPEPPTG